MGVRDLFTWYQKKIDTYDKEKWETTIEQRILYGLPHVQMKSTKPNTDFIDLDLVRGSSSSKVKPKQGFMTVTKVATLRCILLPLYSKWWMQQTSVPIFVVMFCLYISQLINIAIYYKSSMNEQLPQGENIMCMELIVPFLMTWVLSLVHSQIAATIPISDPQKVKFTKTRSFRHRLSISRKLNDTSSADSNLKANMKIRFNLSHEQCNSSNISNSNTSNRKTGVKNIKPRQKAHGDDDGFESLNGNGSRTSEEELVTSSKDLTSLSRERCDDWVTKQTLSNRSQSESRFSTEMEESEGEAKSGRTKMMKRNKCRIPVINVTSTIDSTCDTDDEDAFDKCTKVVKDSCKVPTPTSEWMNVTTNSEDCSYSSDVDDVSDGHIEQNEGCDHDFTPAAIYNTPSMKVSCIIWKKNEVKKAELSTLDISSAIIGKVESTSQSMDYFYVGIIISTVHAFIPVIFRLCNSTLESNALADGQYSIFELSNNIIEKLPSSITAFIEAAFGVTLWERAIIVMACLQRWVLASLFFFLLSVAENIFKRRFLYAKLFSHLTSLKLAQQSELPHFRLNKVRNIKTWLSVRSYLKQRGPQRSVDVIVSTAFIITLLLLSFLCVELLKETGALNSQYHVEAIVWSIGLGILLLRFMTLGNKINKKYRNLSVLMTEQINLHLQIEQKPHKKDELTLANNVLKLAIDLIKELQSPFKISGLSANSILYNTTKLIILSALSGILSEVLGFKLKLHKIKIK